MSENLQMQDISSLVELTKQSVLAEQERAKLEAARLEEEQLRRQAEEERVAVIKALTDKIDALLISVSDMKPVVDMMARNGDTIVEILRILASNITHMTTKDMEAISDHVSSVISAQQSRFNAPVNVHVGTHFTSAEDLNITTNGDQKIG